MPTERWSFWRDQAVVALVLTIATICLGLLLDYVKDDIGVWSLLGAAGVMLLVLVVGSWSAHSLIARPAIGRLELQQRQISDALHQAVVQRCDELGGCLATAERGIEGLRLSVDALKAMTGRAWLLSREELLAEERKANVSEIWIISRSLDEETDPSFIAVVKNNLKRGITYRYIVPDQPATRARAQQVCSAHGDARRVQVVFVSDDLFVLVAPQDIALFGPIGRNADSVIGYMNLPIGEGGNEFFLRLGNEHVRELVGRLMPRVGIK